MKRPEDISEKINKVVTLIANIAEDFVGPLYFEQVEGVMEMVGVESNYCEEIIGLLSSKDIHVVGDNRNYVRGPLADDEYEVSDDLKLLLKEIEDTPLLTSEEEFELAQRMAQGDETAREMLLKGNFHVVVRIAKSYRYLGAPLKDIIEEGLIGLIHASHLYDVQKNVPFGIYAVFWIRRNIISRLSRL